MITGLPSVVRMKYRISSGSRHGNALSRPITRLRVIAQISDTRMGCLATQTAIGALMAGWLL